MARIERPQKLFTIRQVAEGMGVSPARIRYYLHYYGAKRPSGSKIWLLSVAQVWGMIKLIGRSDGHWRDLSTQEMERLLGAPMPDALAAIMRDSRYH